MKISRFAMNPFGLNCYILWSGPGGECIVIDPGMMTTSEQEMITSFIEENKLTLKHLLLTHCHVDHIFSARWLATRYGVEVEAGAKEEVIAKSLPLQAARFGLKIESEPLVIDRILAEGDVIDFAGEKIHVLETPGHSPGSLSFYCPDSSVVFTGDAVFQGSIGRTDLPGGSFSVLIDSIKTKILTLPPDTVIAPGHGDTTTVADEKVYNPYL
ncbi:MAG: MBL fold metallo-hydrolase [Muribaculaceae bacterium]|nr:MBL fold metallo-hydrolase [Muribaculaceae bacterium]